MVISMALSLVMVLLGKLGVPAASEAALGPAARHRLRRGPDAGHAELPAVRRRAARGSAGAGAAQVASSRPSPPAAWCSPPSPSARLAWLLFGMLGLQLDYGYCLLFGALIAPTDPVAVLAIMRSAGVPQEPADQGGRGEPVQRRRRRGGVPGDRRHGALGRARPRWPASPSCSRWRPWAASSTASSSAGSATGCWPSVDNYQIEVLLTLALVMGGYALAQKLHVSGPLAMVVAGLLIGNRGRALAMSETHPGASGRLLGAGRRDPQRGAVPAHRPRGAGRGGGSAHAGRRAAGDPAGAAGTLRQRERAGAVHAPLPRLQPRRHPRAHLGRAARRHLGGPGAVAARAARRATSW